MSSLNAVRFDIPPPPVECYPEKGLIDSAEPANKKIINLPSLSDNTNLVESIIDRHGDKLLAFLKKRVLLPADADDLFQEVCLKIFLCQYLRSIDNIEAYVFTIAMNVLRSKYRRGSNRVIFLPLPFTKG
jgi:DNA-directed RNA polymerase specialized sigma24 family protein